MQIDELTRGMRAGEHTMDAPLPDVEALRGRGRVGRRNRRLARVGAVAAVLAVVVGGWLVTAGLRDDAAPPRPAKPDSTKVLNAYERRVLSEVPGSYAVEGMVVVPAPIDPQHPVNETFRVPRFEGPLASLGWRAFTDRRDVPVPTSLRYPDFMGQRTPEAEQNAEVLGDNGPLRLGCVPRPGPGCNLVYVGGSNDLGWFSLMHDPSWMHLGTPDFLKPGSDMELFTLGGLRDGELLPAVVGGFPGTTATRVTLTLRGGSTARATVDSGHVVPGATVFWARTQVPMTKATAYDAQGRVVAEHALTPCDNRIDCQSR